jgi:hypothetical protein
VDRKAELTAAGRWPLAAKSDSSGELLRTARGELEVLLPQDFRMLKDGHRPDDSDHKINFDLCAVCTRTDADPPLIDCG